MHTIASTRLSHGLISVVAVLIAVFCGALISQGENLITLFVIGLIVGLFLLMLPTPNMVWMTMFFTFLIQGSIQYYGKTGRATWAAFGLSALILIKMIASMIGRASSKSDNSTGSGVVAIWLAAYVGTFLLSFIINLPTLGQTISAFKNAIPAMGILLAIGWGNWQSKSITQLWWLILLAGVIQLPPVIHQHFFVAASRIDQGWDSVVGTMGGSQEGGGLNAMLVLLAIVSLVFALARHKRGLLGFWSLAFVSAVSLAVMLLGEVKAVFIWLPAALLLLYWRAMLRNPGKAIVALAGVAVLLTIIFTAYQALYWDKQKLSRKTFTERIEKIGGYFFDADQMNYQTGEVGRVASITLWVNDPRSTSATRVFGYGPGASKSVSVLGQGEVAYRYAPLGIDSTTIATLLWDVGLLGSFCFLGFMFAPMRVANQLIKANILSSSAAAEIETAVVTLVLMCSLLIYNRTLVDQIITQSLAYLAIGTIVFHARRSAGGPLIASSSRR